jgi:hypothetical protein
MARVFIYLLREDQRVRFVLRQHPPEVRERIDTFREYVQCVMMLLHEISNSIHKNNFKIASQKFWLCVNAIKSQKYHLFQNRFLYDGTIKEE